MGLPHTCFASHLCLVAAELPPRRGVAVQQRRGDAAGGPQLLEPADAAAQAHAQLLGGWVVVKRRECMIMEV